MKFLKRLVLMSAFVAVAGVVGDKFEWSQKLEATAYAGAAKVVELYQSKSDEDT